MKCERPTNLHEQFNVKHVNLIIGTFQIVLLNNPAFNITVEGRDMQPSKSLFEYGNTFHVLSNGIICVY